MASELARIGFLAAVLFCVQLGVARPDGGVVVFRAVAAPFVITVFASPVPLRVGPVDISVMVQDASTSKLVLGAIVTVSLRAVHTRGPVIEAPASARSATNKLLYNATPGLPRPGEWELGVRVQRGATEVTVTRALPVVASRAALLDVWGYLALPVWLTALFILHQYLSYRRPRPRQR